MINCPKCKKDMIWGGDHDVEDLDGNERIESNLRCPLCDTEVLILWGLDNDNK